MSKCSTDSWLKEWDEPKRIVRQRLLSTEGSEDVLRVEKKKNFIIERSEKDNGWRPKG